MRAPLPLVLVAAMVVFAIGIEVALVGVPDLLSKAPLAALVVWSLARAARLPRPRRPERP